MRGFGARLAFVRAGARQNSKYSSTRDQNRTTVDTDPKRSSRIEASLCFPQAGETLEALPSQAQPGTGRGRVQVRSVPWLRASSQAAGRGGQARRLSIATSSLSCIFRDTITSRSISKVSVQRIYQHHPHLYDDSTKHRQGTLDAAFGRQQSGHENRTVAGHWSGASNSHRSHRTHRHQRLRTTLSTI